MKSPKSAGEEFRRRVAFRIIRANAFAAAVAWVAIELSAPAIRTAIGSESIGERVVFSVINGLLGAAFIGAVVMWASRNRDRDRNRWLDEGRAPTPEERATQLAQPRRTARIVMLGWMVGAWVLGFNAAVRDGFGRTAVGAVIVMLLGGLTACALSFFVEEQATRSVRVLALADASPTEGAPILGVRRRILAAWALGSGLPLAWIALVPQFRSPHADVPLAALTTVLAVIGVASGATTAYLTARSVAEPVEDVRKAMVAVTRGQLDVAVPVTDVDELGMLQAGFNHMVAAVAERERLRSLFGRHVGGEVAKQALERGVELGGESVEASVLFIDLIGSSSLPARLAPNEVVALLNSFFAVVVHAAEVEGGWVNKFEGDGALCVFGPPAGAPDHAAQALRAALAMRRELGDLNAAIGVSTGSVVAGNVGTETRSEYTVVGAPVNEAARLAEHAKQARTRLLVSTATIGEAPGEAHKWIAAGTLDLRGIGEVEAFTCRDGAPA